LARSGEEERSNNNNAVVGGGGGGGAVKIEWVRKTKKREALFSMNNSFRMYVTHIIVVECVVTGGVIVHRDPP
jgi:hypothetical protein